MNIIIHDLDDAEFEKLHDPKKEDDIVITMKNSPKSCIGCFGCWTKTPGECVLKDGYQHMGELLSQASTVTIISACTYGGYSPQIKSVIDRSISFVLPFFVTRKDETHHQQRYGSAFALRVFFYGQNLSEQEKKTARELVQANSKNFYYKDYQVAFADSFLALAGKLQIEDRKEKTV